MEDTKKIKIPLGFMLCSFTETFERLAYYLSRSILLIFITTSVAQGGLALDDTVGANMQSNLTAFAYGAAIIGGIIVDRWIGARWTTPVGMLVAGAGYYVGSVATGVGSLYLMIILVSFGLGLFRNAPILGRIITDKKVMDSAFSIRYTLVNLGATLGPVIGGVLYKDTFAKNGVLGFAPCFRISAAIMVLGAVYYVLVCWRHIGDVGRVPFDKTKTQEEIEEEKMNKAVSADGAKQPLTTLEKNRIIAIIIVCLLQILYWIFSFLAFLPLYYYWAGKMDWTIGGWEMPVTWAESFNGIWCMILGPVFAVIWGKLASRSQGDISMFRKTGLGIGILGLSYLYYIILDVFNSRSPISALWLIIWAFLMTTGEMTYSPLVHSFISKYSPSRYLGVMIACSSLAIFAAGKLYGPIYGVLFGGSMGFRTACGYVTAICLVAAAIIIMMDKKVANLVDKRD